jgi:hypothetical protein
MLFAYFSPDVTLPIASILVAAGGFIMMVGKAPFRFAAKGIRAVIRAMKGGGKKDGE